MNLDKKRNFIINFIYFFIVFALLYLCIKWTAVYLFPFVFGIIIAYIVQKPAIYLSEKYKIKKGLSAAVLSVFFYMFLIAVVAFLIWILYLAINKYFISFVKNGELNNIFDNFMTIFNNRTKNIDASFKKISYEAVNEFVNKFAKYLSEFFASTIKKIPNIFICCIVTVVASFYIAKDYDKIKKFIKGFASDGFYKTSVEIKNITLECITKYFLGYFVLFIITFLLLLISFLILNIPNYLSLAVIISLIDILPLFGTGIVLLPWSIIEFSKKNILLAVGLIIVYLIVVGVKNFVEPKIIGKQMGVNPIFSLIFIFLGLRLGGIFGMIILPIILTAVFNFLRKKYLINDFDF